MDSINGISY